MAERAADREGKLRQVSFRTTEELGARLVQAASVSGRSLTQEIERRLELSLAEEDFLRRDWGEDIFRIAQALGRSASFIREMKGKAWHEDDTAAELFKITASQIIQNYRDHVQNVQHVPPTGAVAFSELAIEEQAQWLARLGGLPPPRERRKPVEWLADDEAPPQ